MRGNLSEFHASRAPREDRFAIFHGYSGSDIRAVRRAAGAAKMNGSKFPDPEGRYSRNDEVRSAQRGKHESNRFINERPGRKLVDRLRVFIRLTRACNIYKHIAHILRYEWRNIRTQSLRGQ